MGERAERGLLDTSVVVDLERLDPHQLPDEVAISVVTLAELSAGPAAAKDPAERARRQDRLQRTEAAFDALPLDIGAARAYGRVYAAVQTHGRQPRRRMAELLIAATALSENLALVTRNGDDFAGLDQLLTVLVV